MINLTYGIKLEGSVDFHTAFSLTGVIGEKSVEVSGNVICNAVTTEYVYPHYEGPYTVTPTQSTQTLNTNGFVMDNNVKVNPIPSNYGLITWNGSFLTVS